MVPFCCCCNYATAGYIGMQVFNFVVLSVIITSCNVLTPYIRQILLFSLNVRELESWIDAQRARFSYTWGMEASPSMPIECLTWFECQSNDSIGSHFVYRIHCLSTFWNLTIMASVATKWRAENKPYKIKYKALKELEKGTPHEDVASFSECQKIPSRYGKITKTKSLKSITVALFQKE